MSYGSLISIWMLLVYLFCGIKFVESDETCHGDLRVKDERGNCICRLGYEGEKNSIAPCNDINECLDNPCQKGGSCVNMEGGYTCSCLPGWEGKNCSEAIDACADNPCQNGGTCNNLREAYKCMCPQGFDGENCTDIVEAPSIIEPPQTEVRVVEGMNVSFTCSCKGSPNPHLSWRFNNIRHEIVTNGLTSSISIKFVMRADAGEYICFAVNKHGTAKAAGRLVVREKTTIITPPSSQYVTKGETVMFTIGIHVDPNEKHHLKVKWYKDNEEIVLGPKFLISGNYSMIILDSAVADTGNYKCKVDAELDSTEASAKLVVKDRPEAPQNITVSCQASQIEITWASGFDNNDPIEEFLVCYESSLLPGVTQTGPRVAAGKSPVAILEVIPWVNYTIYMLAQNSKGKSMSSVISKCETPAAVPNQHPENVCVESREASQLVITWKPIAAEDKHGDGFHYIVNYKRRDLPDAKEEKIKVYGLESSRLIVVNQPMMTEYVIYVQAANTVGIAKTTAKKIIGYSGEGKPLNKPDKVWTDKSLLNANSVVLHWNPVDTSPARIKGYFRGYRISFWPQSSPDQLKLKDIIFYDATNVKLCYPLDEAKPLHQLAVDEKTVRVQLTDLKPYTIYEVSVSVLNLGHSGERSESIVFKTDESKPGPVTYVHCSVTTSKYLTVNWDPPKEFNGEIVKHNITYEPVFDTLGGTKLRQMVTQSFSSNESLSENKVTLTQLTPNTKYNISVSACTSKGCGKAAISSCNTTVADNHASAASVPWWMILLVVFALIFVFIFVCLMIMIIRRSTRNRNYNTCVQKQNNNGTPIKTKEDGENCKQEKTSRTESIEMKQMQSSAYICPGATQVLEIDGSYSANETVPMQLLNDMTYENVIYSDTDSFSNCDRSQLLEHDVCSPFKNEVQVGEDECLNVQVRK